MSKRIFSFSNVPVFSLLLVLLGGCRGSGIQPVSSGLPADPPSLAPVAVAVKDSGPQVPEEVSLEDVSALALQHHPDLRRFSYAERAADARRLIARRLPNPSLTFEMEDFAGSGQFSGTRSAIYTGTLVQVLETGGKRSARTAGAVAELAQVRADYEVRRREVLADGSHGFVFALAAKEAVALAEHELHLAEVALRSVEEQIEAGRANASQRKLAEMTVIEARLGKRLAERGLESALARLATLWGGGAIPAGVQGRLSPPPNDLPSRDRLADTLEEHPEILRARRGEKLATSKAQMARAARYPDIELGVGARQDKISGDNALVVSASVPLPLFETGRDGVRAAEAEARAARVRTDSVRVDLERRFEMAWAEFADGHDAAVTIEQELLPGAREVFRSIDESYQLGRTGFLEWLEARRQLAKANRRWLEARRDYQLAAATLQTLTGLSF